MLQRKSDQQQVKNASEVSLTLGSPNAIMGNPPLRVLLVDDAKTIRSMLTKQLRRKGIHVEAAEDGIVGLEKWKAALNSSCPFDAVITDMTMPRMNGDELAACIREAEAEAATPEESEHSVLIIGVTGNVLPEDIRSFCAAGANKVLSKPISANSLYDVLLSVK
jgi:two-component system capsular synthesis sensor histidine kinase RcsC